MAVLNTSVPLLYYYFVYDGIFAFENWFTTAFNSLLLVNESIWGFVLVLSVITHWDESSIVSAIYNLWATAALAGPLLLYWGVVGLFVTSMVLEETFGGLSLEAMITYTATYALLSLVTSMVQLMYLPDLRVWHE